MISNTEKTRDYKILDLVSEAILVCTPTGLVTFCNEIAKQLFPQIKHIRALPLNVSFDKKSSDGIVVYTIHKHTTNMSRYKDEFEGFRYLGQGGFGTVFEVTNKIDSSKYAIKKIVLRPNYTDKILQEVRLFAQITTHQNVVRYYNSWIETTPKNATLFIQMQLCDCKDLRNYIDSRSVINYKENLVLLKQILSGLAHIHSHQIIHHDLKPENVFLAANALLGDFGLSRPVEFVEPDDQLLEPLENFYGTTFYIDPSSTNNSIKNDIYSLGIIIVEMFVLFKTTMERAITLNKIREQGVCVLESVLDKEILHLVSKCICGITDRANACELIKLDVFDNID